jgi:glycerate 2-kinase
MRGLRVEDGRFLMPGGRRVRVEGRTLRLVAVGKAAGGMAAQAQRWGKYAEAVVVAPYDAGIPEYECLVGDHPVPTERSVRAGERVLDVARACGPDDLLLVLLSGGASAMAESPAVPLADLQRTTDLVLRAGADVRDLNAVRKHLSRVKGGRLLQACRGEVLLLAISDVAGEDLATLGSGPVTPDPTTFADALEVLDQRGVLESVPPSVREHLQAGARGERGETLKPGAPEAARVTSVVLADNDAALRGGAQAAARLGYETRVLFGFLRGEARDRGRQLAMLARDLARQPGPPVAVLAGGETTVHVTGDGRGGRNQEVALAAVDGVSALDALVACMGTDGIDGPTDAAGALADGRTLTRAKHLHLDPAAHLAENDAYDFGDALDDLIRTGPTGTNARDVALLLVRRKGPA